MRLGPGELVNTPLGAKDLLALMTAAAHNDSKAWDEYMSTLKPAEIEAAFRLLVGYTLRLMRARGTDPRETIQDAASFAARIENDVPAEDADDEDAGDDHPFISDEEFDAFLRGLGEG